MIETTVKRIYRRLLCRKEEGRTVSDYLKASDREWLAYIQRWRRSHLDYKMTGSTYISNTVG